MAKITLNKIATGKLEQAAIVALARLHLWTTAATHEMLFSFASEARAILLRRAGGADGVFDGASGFQAQREILSAWGDVHAAWTKMMLQARQQAAILPFGLMAEMHGRLVRPLALTEARGKNSPPALTGIPPFQNPKWGEMGEALGADGGVFGPQIRLLLDAVNQRVYGDGLNLSGRIWKLDRETRDGINALIVQAIADKRDAWSVAKDLQQYLGGNQDCPRWTKSRLYYMSKADIAGGDLGGLVSGDACDGQGVAYKALRLARTEIQAAHARATDVQLANSPWVEQEQINITPGHVGEDVCDEVIANGEGGKGIYPVGTIVLPLHPLCLCYKTAIMMSDKAFTARMRGWLNGSKEWDDMDRYADMVGGAGADLSKDPSRVALGVWLGGGAGDLAGAMVSSTDSVADSRIGTD